jgi:glutamate---cysteine ligase / carboxylate-amine ligase
VTLELARILASGTGSRRQRDTMAKTQSLSAVVLDAVERTHGTANVHRRPRRLQAT